MGLEPTTSTLARLRSTTELHPHFVCVQNLKMLFLKNQAFFYIILKFVYLPL